MKKFQKEMNHEKKLFDFKIFNGSVFLRQPVLQCSNSTRWLTLLLLVWLPCPETIALIGHYQVTWSLHRSAIGENMVLNWALLHNNDMTRDEHMIFVIFFQIIEKTNLYLFENVPILDMCCIVIILANNPIKSMFDLVTI